MILDVTATLPQVASLLSYNAVILKVLRLYQLWLLHYPVELALNVYLSNRDKTYIYALVYAFATFCQIMILLHFLACFWIYLGSESFLDFEDGHEPWLLANADFKGMSRPQLILFSTYWVCTVITCVGYGDYTGSTSVEYLFSLGIELFGFIIFAVLRISIL